MSKLSLSHAADPIGFTFDVGFGRAWQIFHATDPARGGNEYIPQAYVSLKPERWGGLQFDFGKFYTSAGAELTENNLTWSYGRGFLYTNGPVLSFRRASYQAADPEIYRRPAVSERVEQCGGQ